MPELQIKFDDGASYERMMGTWSRLVGEGFLGWVNLPSGLRCIDIGCGNGAFTELLVERCAPVEVQGVDPSAGQLVFARERHKANVAKFQQGDAMALPFGDSQFDAATMALVIFFVPEPAKGVAEMARVVRPGGTVAAYAWDMLGGGFPLEPIRAELRDMGIALLNPPSVGASRITAMRDLWTQAGLDDVETTQIAAQRTFANFDDFWAVSILGSSLSPTIASMSPDDIEQLKSRVRAKLPTDASGRITYSARANAVKGGVPK